MIFIETGEFETVKKDSKEKYYRQITLFWMESHYFYMNWLEIFVSSCWIKELS